MAEVLKELKVGEAELFFRTKDCVLKLQLPSDVVKEFESLKDSMKTDDILEILVRSTRTMAETVNSLKSGKYKHKDEKGRITRIDRK